MLRIASPPPAQGTELANQIGASKHPLPIRLLKDRKAQIDRDVAKLEAEIGRIIAAEPALVRRREILVPWSLPR